MPRPSTSRGSRRRAQQVICFPTLAVAARSQTSRQETYLGTRYYRQTFQDFQGALDLNYTVFDFGAKNLEPKIDAPNKAEVLAANFEFNEHTPQSHLRGPSTPTIQILEMRQVKRTPPREPSLSNAQGVQHSAEERLNNGLATLPDVLEARSATAQAEYELQTALGAEELRKEIWQPRLEPLQAAPIHTEPLKELCQLPTRWSTRWTSPSSRAIAQRSRSHAAGGRNGIVDPQRSRRRARPSTRP